MSASPEFYKPAPVFSPCSSPLLLHGGGGGGGGVGVGGGDQEGASGVWEGYCCRTPTGVGSELRQGPGTCPPAPRKPKAPAAPCRKRLFEVEVFSLRLEELERLFWRPRTPPPEKKKKRRMVAPPPQRGRPHDASKCSPEPTTS